MIKEDAMFLAIMTTLWGISDSPEFMYYSGIFLAAAVGLIMRVGYQLKHKIFTWRTFGIQLLVGFPMTWLALKLHSTSDIIQVWVCGWNFMALFLLDVLHTIGKMNFTEAAQYWLDKLKGREGQK